MSRAGPAPDSGLVADPSFSIRAYRAMSGLPTLLMLSGTLCDGRVFLRQKRALRGLARVVLQDYDGLRDVAQWTRHLLRRLPERFSVAGFSLGGIGALELLRKAPERVERIAMLASNAEPASMAGRRKSRRLQKVLRRRGATAAVRPLKANYFHHRASRQRHAALVHAMARATPVKAASAEFQWAAMRPEGHTVLARFPGPVLLISGARDPLCPPHWQQSMQATQPRARWIELPRAGHFVTLEAPAQVNDALRRWIQC